ncbi:universal stress protein [Micromonosporaceae bacterium Da 78-11]
MPQRGSHRAQRGLIVVGVNGSPGSKTALRWALEQAERTAAGVEAVIVWAPGALSYYGSEWTPAALVTDDLAAAAHTVLLDTLVEVAREHGRSAPIRPRVIQGHPADDLIRASRAAQLLVLGSPTHSTIAGLLLGSVSHQCVQRATCPVLVTPAVSNGSSPRPMTRNANEQFTPFDSWRSD